MNWPATITLLANIALLALTQHKWKQSVIAADAGEGPEALRHAWALIFWLMAINVTLSTFFPN